MKINFPRQIIKPPIKTIEDADKAFSFLYSHIQSINDCLIQIVSGNLSLNLNEKNLPLSLVKVNMVSGISKTISGYGATIIYVGDNAIIDKFAYKTIGDNLLEITVLFDDNKQHDIVFLTVREKLPI